LCSPASTAGKSRAECIDAVEVRLERRGALFFDCRFVHAGAEVVADFLLGGVAPFLLFSQLVEHAPQEALVVLRQLAVHRPARLVGRDRVVLHPAAAGVLVKVFARIGGLVHRAHIQARGVRERGGGMFLRGGRRGRWRGLGRGDRAGTGHGQGECETNQVAHENSGRGREMRTHPVAFSCGGACARMGRMLPHNYLIGNIDLLNQPVSPAWGLAKRRRSIRTRS
jgi:hypothetical protein